MEIVFFTKNDISHPKQFYIGNMGLFDPTEIHNRGMIKKHMRNCMIYLGYFLIFFFIYLYWWVKYQSKFKKIVFLLFFFNFIKFPSKFQQWSKSISIILILKILISSLINALLKGDPIRRHEDGEIITEF